MMEMRTQVFMKAHSLFLYVTLGSYKYMVGLVDLVSVSVLV